MRDRNARVPNLRFPEFRDAGPWEEKRLGDVAKRVTNKNSDHENTRVLTNSAIEGIVDQRDYFDKDIANKNNLTGYFIVRKGDYVYNPRVSSSAPVGPIGRNNIGTGVMSPLYTIFRFHETNSDYHEHYFKTTCWHDYIRAVGSSGARHDRMSLSVFDFINMPVLEPCVEEKQKIADCLTSLDDLITAQAQKLDALKAHKKGLMQQLFPSAGETIPSLRFPEFRDAGAWEEKRLKIICQMQAGNFVSASKINEIPDDDLYPCYGGNGLRGFTKTYTHIGKYSLIGRQGALCGNITLAIGKFHATEHAVVTTPIGNTDVDWLFYLLIKFDLNQYATGQAQPGLSVKNLEEITATVPKQEEQQKIATCLTSIDDLITAQAQKLEYLKAHKKGLMQQLFPAADKVNE